jgi:hypothetical protein
MSAIKKWLAVLVSICGNWLSIMSGGVSIPLAVIALCLGGAPGVWLGVLAFIALLICTGNMGKVNYALLQKQKPRITTHCERAPAIDAASLRLRICSESDAPIEGCQARIIQIKTDDDASPMEVHSAPLMFVPNELNIVEKTIAPRSVEIVDVILVGKRHFLPGTQEHHWVADRSFGDYFPKYGDYFLTIEIRGNMPTERVVLKFKWNGWETATLEKSIML